MLYKNILLIDDDIDDTEVFLDALNSLKSDAIYRILLDPIIALAELKKSDQVPDLIFLDYNMPALNGLEFLTQMKKDAKLQKIEVILISTPPEEFMYEWLKQNNITVEYISKPRNYDDIKAMFGRFIK